MIVLVQDSQGTSSTTVQNVKTVVRAMLRRLSSESTDFKFALATYATSRQMSCFGSADETISYINNEYQYGGSGLNRLNLALSKMVLKQFEKRRGDRKTDTAKVRFTFGSNCVITKLSGIQKEGICILIYLFFVSKLYCCKTETFCKTADLKFQSRLQSYISTTDTLGTEERGRCRGVIVIGR